MLLGGVRLDVIFIKELTFIAKRLKLENITERQLKNVIIQISLIVFNQREQFAGASVMLKANFDDIMKFLQDEGIIKMQST